MNGKSHSVPSEGPAQERDKNSGLNSIFVPQTASINTPEQIPLLGLSKQAVGNLSSNSK